MKHPLIDIVFEDSSLIVVCKPQGLPTASGQHENLCHLLFPVRPDCAAVHGYREGEGGLLNRLDNETGGLVLFAKTAAAFAFYSQAMREERIIKTYSAVVDGTPQGKAGEITFPIAHSAKSARRMVIADGRSAFRGHPRRVVTAWRLVKTHEARSLLSVDITKGARHQIRLHLAAIGLPVVGDKLYNKKKSEYKPKNHLLFCNALMVPKTDGSKQRIAVPEPYNELVKAL